MLSSVEQEKMLITSDTEHKIFIVIPRVLLGHVMKIGQKVEIFDFADRQIKGYNSKLPDQDPNKV